MRYCVNPLSIGTPISTQEVSGTGWQTRKVSIPYLSGHPFLPDEADAIVETDNTVCQSPIYRDTHFYGIALLMGISTFIVSIPYLSGHPFLQVANIESESYISGCQSPIYRDTHFYPRREYVIFDKELCQSPIYRDTHFYSLSGNGGRSEQELCQSPIYRDTHFYTC